MFKGSFTALVTPFTEDGQIDHARLAKLIEQQVAGGMTGIVPVGTPGESPTLSYDEHIKVIETSVAAAAGRIKVIAGTGANSTEEALSLTQRAKDAGADGTLQVTPYYNKPSQEGLYQHFSRVADVGLPVVLYNIPGRTAREITIETVTRLAQHSNIVAVKEAAGAVERVSAILHACDLTVLSGDDVLTLPMMSVGGSGVISVASNVAPGLVSSMVQAALDERWSDALALHNRLYPLFSALLSLDTNPVPIKAAMALKGLIPDTYRLPMCPISDENRATLQSVMTASGLL
ncbi:MAG: 4-hydroxy-tetrahydrodipicolinate synthase [Kiritimatiellae bacterium]|nr:4-hydroxy-tetrahydrodipicolinate synthase [Kiritimatiellia bacterium]